MPRLSSSVEYIKNHYTVVVVGSGYGGAIAASRMAGTGQQVCVLERGKEFQPGEYPFTELHAARELQVDLPGAHIGAHTGLYDLRVNKDISVFLGCGLGGTSLVNANVALRAEPRVFDDPAWPQAIREDLTTSLKDGYSRAEEMLKPTPYPEDFPKLPKLEALEKSADHLQESFYRPPINVTFKTGVNHVGVEQQACKLCGDCVSGCNYAAKNTTLMNYLPDAKNHGAEIYTEVSVRRIEREEGRWLVFYQPVGADREKFGAREMFVSADIVILGAGTLGSTEILLRSRAAGLSLSDKLGHGFSGNGDVLGFGYNCDVPINGTGFGPNLPGELEPVGPCITGIIDMREKPELDSGMVIEEGSIPGGISSLLATAFVAGALAMGEDTDAGMADLIREKGRELDSLVRGPYNGAVLNSQTYLVMTHDGGAGQMALDDDRLRVSWPGVGTQPIFTEVNNTLKEATRPLGGTYIRNPTWSKLTANELVTVHPLGGCVMAEDAERGVVNHKGQVFAGSQGAEVYKGLYVSDGSVVPRSLGVNPLLTISAITERCCAVLARDNHWQIDYSLPSAPAEEQAPERLGIEFTETMRGFFSAKVTDDYRRAEQQGATDDSRCEFTVTVISNDLEDMLEEQNHRAKIIGTATIPSLSAEPMTVTGGEFNLFVFDPEQPGSRLMRYRMNMVSEEGHNYHFDGFKIARDDPGFDVWTDTTTLYITVHDGDIGGPVIGKGVLRIEAADFMRQMTTVKILNAGDLERAMKANARFGRFFAGALFDVYGDFLTKWERK